MATSLPIGECVRPDNLEALPRNRRYRHVLSDLVKRRILRDTLFRVAVCLKGIDGIIEIIGGVALLLVSSARILHVVGF